MSCLFMLITIIYTIYGHATHISDRFLFRSIHSNQKKRIFQIVLFSFSIKIKFGKYRYIGIFI